MPVTINNTNTNPMAIQGASAALPAAPTSIAKGQPVTANSNSPSIASQSVSGPTQIVGLVPVFPCCAPALPCVYKAIGVVHVQEQGGAGGGANAVFQVLLGPNATSLTTYGPWTWTLSTSASAVAALINAGLPAGLVATVTKTTGGVYTITLTGNSTYANWFVNWTTGTGNHTGTIISGTRINFTCYTNGQSAIDAQALTTVNMYGLSSPNSYQWNYILNGTHIFPISIPAPITGYTTSSIAAIINAAFSGTGITCLVTVNSGSFAGDNVNLNIVLVAPPGTTTTYNGVTVTITSVNIKTFQTNPFSGGQTGQSTPANPANNVCSCECRYGLYTADSIADDRNFTLPVFADLTCSDAYHNDINSFLFSYPGTYNPITNNDFTLTKLINGVWTQVAVLNNSTYGTPIYQACSSTSAAAASTVSNAGGYIINWSLVLAALGEGIYEFNVNSVGYTQDTGSWCFVSPPFCLKAWTCIDVDATVKWETVYNGGTFGSVTTQGVSWSLCCKGTAVQWKDSIRFFGFFGYETAEFQRDFVKYATGVIDKVRDEAVKKFTTKTDRLPMWLHERFYAYGLQADQLYVSDYNINNANYNYKHFWVVADGNYTPQYTTYSRYTKILDLAFKEGDQFVFRDRCC
jgi:hypothetical protein